MGDCQEILLETKATLLVAGVLPWLPTISLGLCPLALRDAVLHHFTFAPLCWTEHVNAGKTTIFSTADERNITVVNLWCMLHARCPHYSFTIVILP